MICVPRKFPFAQQRTILNSTFRLRAHGCPFEALGLDRDATREEARAAYVKKMKEIHPDLTSDDTTSLATTINLAYEQILVEITSTDSTWNRKDVFDVRNGVPEIAFIDPFRCANFNPLEWRRLQDLISPDRSIEDSLLSAGVTYSESAICYLTPDQFQSIVKELDRMELTLDFETCQWYLSDCLTRARWTNSKAF